MRIPGGGDDQVLEYELLGFPFTPLLLVIPNSYGERSSSDGASMVTWLRSIETGRTRYVEDFVSKAGFAVDSDSQADVGIFDQEISAWIPKVFQPAFGSYWSYLPDGAPRFPGWKSGGSSNRAYQALDISLAVDIALVVLDRARHSLDLKWAVSHESTGSVDPQAGQDFPSYLPTLQPGDPALYPVSMARGLIENALVQADSIRDKAIKDWHASGQTTLGEMYSNLTNG